MSGFDINILKEKTEKSKNKKEFCRNHKTTSRKLLVLQFPACRLEAQFSRTAPPPRPVSRPRMR